MAMSRSRCRVHPLSASERGPGGEVSYAPLRLKKVSSANPKRLGIENPAEHFRGKVVRISGSVERSEGKSGTEYVMQVTNLDQFEEIRAATAG